jgi:hypothetical protein
MKLERESEKSLKDGVEIRMLDATIRDAIKICRGLEIQYLWVDALCIFQDEESDWLKQSSQMSHIYGTQTNGEISGTSPQPRSWSTKVKAYFLRKSLPRIQQKTMAP